MRSLFFLLGFGGMPLWLAILFVFYAYSTKSGENAGMAFWALVPAIPMTLATSVIASVTLVIHTIVNGNNRKKTAIAGSFFVLATIALLIFAGKPFWEKKQAEKKIEIERPLVEKFVRESALVQDQAGVPKAVSIASHMTIRDNHMPSTYDVRVEGSRRIYAIVKVDRTKEPATFFLECTTMLFMGQRDVRKGPCEQ